MQHLFITFPAASHLLVISDHRHLPFRALASTLTAHMATPPPSPALFCLIREGWDHLLARILELLADAVLHLDFFQEGFVCVKCGLRSVKVGREVGRGSSHCMSSDFSCIIFGFHLHHIWISFASYLNNMGVTSHYRSNTSSSLRDVFISFASHLYLICIVHQICIISMRHVHCIFFAASHLHHLTSFLHHICSTSSSHFLLHHICLSYQITDTCHSEHWHQP